MYVIVTEEFPSSTKNKFNNEKIQEIWEKANVSSQHSWIAKEFHLHPYNMYQQEFILGTETKQESTRLNTNLSNSLLDSKLPYKITILLISEFHEKYKYNVYIIDTMSAMKSMGENDESNTIISMYILCIIAIIAVIVGALYIVNR